MKPFLGILQKGRSLDDYDYLVDSIVVAASGKREEVSWRDWPGPRRSIQPRARTDVVQAPP